MLGLLYILICVGLGYVICRICFPNMRGFCNKTYGGAEVGLSPMFLCLPAWFIFGTLPMTWLTYGVGYAFRNYSTPLLQANAIVMPVVGVLVIVSIFFLNRKEKDSFKDYFSNIKGGEIIFFGLVTVFFLFLMLLTFFCKDGKYCVGWSVASDFAPHIGMIRSFAVSNNFPTSYSHFAGEDIKYHFMFQFLVGNLNFLGMRLDIAFNLPSLLGLVNLFFFLYFYTVKIFGKRLVGVIASILFTFRSSQAFLDFTSSIPKEEGVLKTLLDNSDFIGTTEHEDWGLWNLNVYCNQRHLALGICVLLFLLIYFTQFLFQAASRTEKNAEEKLLSFLSDNPEENLLPGEKIEYVVRESLFKKDGWLPGRLRKPIACGILLGLCSFFNGACVIACLSVLFLMAFVSDRRLEFAMTAAISVVMSVLSTKLFINGSAVSPEFYFGFLAKNHTFFGVIKYIVTLCGILPLLVLVSLLICKKSEKYLVFTFTAPIIIAFTLSLTVDVSVNHKYIMIGLMLLGIPVAALLERIARIKGLYAKLLSMFLIICLTITGFYEVSVIYKRNEEKTGNVMILDEKSDICQFVMNHATAQDLFLTSWYSLNEFVLGGAMLYYGWPYYAWSAGYNTDLRELYVRRMYSADTSEKLDSLVKQCNIRFIVVDWDVRERAELQLNEENIQNTYAMVFNNGSTQIYDTQYPLFNNSLEGSDQ